VDSMVLFFGNILRAELVNLMETPQSSRIRAHSTGSHASFDSNDGQNPVNNLDDHESDSDSSYYDS
jgi:hypothetical protein